MPLDGAVLVLEWLFEPSTILELFFKRRPLLRTIATRPRPWFTRTCVFAFDGNHYCVPPRYVGCTLTVKADASALMIYDQHQQVASYARCWQRGQVLGVEHFQKELLAQKG